MTFAGSFTTRLELLGLCEIVTWLIRQAWWLQPVSKPHIDGRLQMQRVLVRMSARLTVLEQYMHEGSRSSALSSCKQHSRRLSLVKRNSAASLRHPMARMLSCSSVLKLSNLLAEERLLHA